MKSPKKTLSDTAKTAATHSARAATASQKSFADTAIRGTEMTTLEIGGGLIPEHHPNMDIQDLKTVDIVHDMRIIPWSFTDGTFDKVVMNHSLEHVEWKHVINILKEVQRVLKGDGTFQCKVPDIGRTTQLNDWHGAIQVIYGDQNLPCHYHLCGFWKESMLLVLQEVQFQNINIQQTLRAGNPELSVTCVKRP